MVQLFAYDTAGDRYELDLYPEEPVKLTISAEDITDIPKIDSAYSRQFRIPATQNNSRFFSWWYEVNQIDFDVTKKVRAEIYVDGLFYRSGQVRLQAAYVNRQNDQIDLEIVFFGETRDFSSQVGEGFMNQLDTTDAFHELTLTNVQNSWLPLGHPSLLLDGAIRYILADRGYTYDSNNEPIQPSEINGDNHTWTAGGTFVRSQNPLPLDQFTPIVQLKYLVDRIFAQTDYTYSTDSVFNEAWFKGLYTDGLPTASPTISGTSTQVEVDVQNSYGVSDSVEERVEFQNVLFDPSNAWSVATFDYTVPANGTYIFDSNVTIIDVRTYDSGTGSQWTGRMYVNGSVVDTVVQTAASGTPGSQYILNLPLSYTSALVTGDKVWVTVEQTGGASEQPVVARGSYFDQTQANATISIASLLKDDVKIVDFFRSILTKFRLVMVPSKTNEKQFIIKPWEEYVGTGDQFDWTKKLDVSKDVVLQPMFFQQTAIIDFKDQQDQDFVNKFHQDTYNRVYGELKFDAQNDLIQDSRTVTTVFAPTPVDQILGVADSSNFIVPVLCQRPAEEVGGGSHAHEKSIPIKPKPRLLFWNGLIPTSPSLTWYYTDGVTTVSTTSYPRASYLTAIPTTAGTLNLNWAIEFAYFELNGGPLGTSGASVYDVYWNNYIQSLYSSEARLMTAYFVLHAEDLRDLSFDDAIFIHNSWWRVQKIYDAPLTDVASVKVDLIKLMGYPPTAPVDGTSGTSGLGVGLEPQEPTSTSGTTGTSGTTVTETYYNLQSPNFTIVGRSADANLVGKFVRVSGVTYVDECFEVISTTTAQNSTTILQSANSCIELGF